MTGPPWDGGDRGLAGVTLEHPVSQRAGWVSAAPAGSAAAGTPSRGDGSGEKSENGEQVRGQGRGERKSDVGWK